MSENLSDMPDNCVNKWDWYKECFFQKLKNEFLSLKQAILDFFFKTTKIGQISTFDITTYGPKNSKWLIFWLGIIKNSTLQVYLKSENLLRPAILKNLIILFHGFFAEIYKQENP